MDRARFGGFIERGTDALQRFGRIVFLAGAHESQIASLQRVQAGFDAAIIRLFAGAVAHPTFG